MTALRPEGPSYEDTGQFAAAVEQLADPLNDPLPGRGPAPGREAAASPAASEGSPWFRPHEMPMPSGARTATHGQGPEQGPDQLGRGEYGHVPGGEPGRSAPLRQSQARPPAQPPTDAPRVRRRGVPGETVQMPVIAPDEAPAPATEAARDQPSPGGRAARRRAAAVSTTEATTEVTTDAAAEGTSEATTGLRPEGSVAPGGRAARRRAAAGAPTAGDPAPEAAQQAREAQRALQAQQEAIPGGRAARRKAAKQGAAGRTRARTAGEDTGAAPSGSSAAGTAGGSSAPMTRLEARRAARAAKESPAVIVSRIVGELFITLGVLMLLFVTYQLWWTNVRAHQQAGGAANALEHQWEQNGPDRAAGVFSPGQGFAIMYIPKLDVKAPIAEGVSKHGVLDKGMIGHYNGTLATAMPWDKQGNFAVAAHRNTHGEPFRYINRLVPGDKIVVETSTTFYTYEVTSSLPSTPPSNVSVIRPVPRGSGFTGPGRYITLTTCTPEFTSTYRLVVWGKMVDERPRSKGKPDALVE